LTIALINVLLFLRKLNDIEAYETIILTEQRRVIMRRVEFEVKAFGGEEAKKETLIDWCCTSLMRVPILLFIYTYRTALSLYHLKRVLDP